MEDVGTETARQSKFVDTTISTKQQIAGPGCTAYIKGQRPAIPVVVSRRETKSNQEFKRMTYLRKFWQDEQGQDLIEYTLLLAFVCLVAAAIFIGAGQNASTIWVIANNHLSNAAAAAVS